MVVIEIREDLSDTAKFLINDAIKSVKSETRKVIGKWAINELRQNIRKNLSGRVLKSRSGELLRRTDVKYIPSRGIVLVLAGVPYGRIHEEGGIIKGKPYLSIPIAKEAEGKTVKDFPKGFYIRSKKGNYLKVVRAGRGIKPLFVMKEEVKIPSRRWASLAVEESLITLERALDGI